MRRYACRRCSKYGNAHYLLIDGVLTLLCTACFEWYKSIGHSEQPCDDCGVPGCTIPPGPNHHLAF